MAKPRPHPPRQRSGRQLIIYATGAGIRFSDRNAIEAIIAKTKPTQHGIRSLVQEVVASELFQTK